MTKNIALTSEFGDFNAYLSLPEKIEKLPGIILIHEVWGLGDHIKEVSDRFAAQGYAVLAPDLLSHTGITEKIDQTILKEVHNPATRDEAQKKMRAAMAPIMVPEFGRQTLEKIQSCFKYLRSQDFASGKAAVLGFCFGGTYAFALATVQSQLSAAVVFYGQTPEPADKLENITCPVLAFYGEKDERLIGQLPQTRKAMTKYGKDFQSKVYPNTGHAFFNNTNPATYVKSSAQDAWEMTLKFLAENLMV